MNGQYIKIVSDKNPILFSFTWQIDPQSHDLIFFVPEPHQKIKPPAALLLKVAESFKELILWSS